MFVVPMGAKLDGTVLTNVVPRRALLLVARLLQIPAIVSCCTQELKPERVVCPLQLVVANTYVLSVADPPTKTLEHRTHVHVDVVVPNALVVVDVPTHVVPHDTHDTGVMMVAVVLGVGGRVGEMVMLVGQLR